MGPNELFFLPDDDFGDRGGKWTRLLPGRSVCHTCPVQPECLAYALNNGIEYGVWGGLDGRERDRFRKAL